MRIYLFSLLILASVFSCDKQKKKEDETTTTTSTKTSSIEVVKTKAEATCNDDLEGKLVYVSGEKILYACKSGTLTAVDPTGSTGTGFKKLDLSQITPSGVGSNGTAYEVTAGGVIPTSLANASDEYGTAVWDMTTVTSGGTLTNTASYYGCLKWDLKATYYGIVTAKLKVQSSSAVTSNARFEFSNDDVAGQWQMGESKSLPVPTTSKDYVVASNLAGRYVAVCFGPSPGGMSLKFNVYGLEVNYL